MSFTTHTNTPDIVERWPYDFQRISSHTSGGTKDVSGTLDVEGTVDINLKNEILYYYLSAFAQELRRIDVFIDELYEQRFIETATTRELEKLAGEVGVTRRAGEDDDDLRIRAALGKAIGASNGTAEDIEGILVIAFGEDNLDRIDITDDPDNPVIEFEIPQDLIDDIPLSQSEFLDEFEEAFPAGHGVRVLTGNTLLLGQSGANGLGNGELS